MKFNILALFLCLPLQLHASSFYVGADYFKTDLNIGGEKTNPTQSSVRIGKEFWQQVAIEYHHNKSNAADTLLAFDVDLEKSQALYARFISREYDDITMDVTLGYAQSVLSVNGPSGTYNGTDEYEGFAWGISASQRLRSVPAMSFRMAYQSLYDDESLHIRGYSFGFTYHF